MNPYFINCVVFFFLMKKTNKKGQVTEIPKGPQQSMEQLVSSDIFIHRILKGGMKEGVATPE